MSKRLLKLCLSSCLIVFLHTASLLCANVDFPGPLPGNAGVSQTNGVYTIENSVISASWKSVDGRIGPYLLANKLTGKEFEQSGAELFRLSLTPPTTKRGVMVGVRVECAPPVLGMIYYEAETPQDFIAGRAQNLGQANMARIQGAWGTSALTSMIIGF